MYQNPFLDPFTAFSERLGANYDDMRKGPLDKQYVSSQVYQPIDLAGRAVLSGIFSGIKSIVDPTVPLVSGNVKGPLPGNKMSSKEKKGKPQRKAGKKPRRSGRFKTNTQRIAKKKMKKTQK